MKLGFASARLPSLMASVLLVAGCAGPQANEHFYALNDGGVVQSASAASGDPARLLPGIVVSAVTVPELVDRPQIVTRDSQNRVIVSEQNLWAEPLRSGIGRLVAVRLEQSMQSAGRLVQVAAYPQTSITNPYVRVTIDIVRFDAIPNGEAVVEALWSIRRVETSEVRTGRTVVASPIAGAGYEAIVAAWNEALQRVERDIAASVAAIAVPTNPTGK